MIKLEKKGRRIAIFSSQPLNGIKKAIPGAYRTVAGNWTVPLSLESLILLREKYGSRLEPTVELKRWVSGVQENRKSMAKLAAASNARLEVLPRVAPKLAQAMRKRTYQRVGVRFIADNPATLNADEPGLGKTLEALGGIIEAEIAGPYLIVAPKTAADTVWRREIRRWLPSEHRAVILPENQQQRDYKIRTTNYTDKTWLIIHPEILMVQAYWVCHECGKKQIQGNRQQVILPCGHIRDKQTKKVIEPRFPHLFDIEWGAIIADESHESLIQRRGTPTQRRRGFIMLKLRSGGMKLACSGTPFESKPHQLWGTLNWLDPVTYSAFNRWAELFWEKGGYTGFEIGAFRKERERMLWSSLNGIALRRTKAEVAKDLPPKIYVGTELDPSQKDSPIGIWLPMDGKQESAYRQMEETSIAELESGRIEAIYALEELTRLKQMACCYGRLEKTLKNKRFVLEDGTVEFRKVPTIQYIPEFPSNKFNWTIESLEEWGYPKEPLTKVVLVSFYSGILRLFARGIHQHFKVKPDRPLVTGITGRTPAHLRKKVIDDFNRMDRNTPQVMMLNVRAGGTAITIDSADRMIFISQTRNPAQQSQAEDRIHRISNPRHCMYYYLGSLNTVDVGTALVNQELQADTHRLLDERRGVDYVRQVLNLSRM